jgi:hypothetical protein
MNPMLVPPLSLQAVQGAGGPPQTDLATAAVKHQMLLSFPMEQTIIVSRKLFLEQLPDFDNVRQGR